MSEQPAKRQKIAEEQLKHLDELNVDGFIIFLLEYSEYLPYQTFYRIIGRNKQLIQWFNHYTDDNWWRKRTQNDFYDFYDFVVNPDKKTINTFIRDWLRNTITIHENLWLKPWKIVYMVCYAMVTLISTTETPISPDDFVNMPMHFEAQDTTEEFSGNLAMQIHGDKARIFSWITGQEFATIDTPDVDVTSSVRNGFVILNDETTLLYRHENNSVIELDQQYDVDFVKTRNTSNIIVQVSGNVSIFRRKDFLTEPLESEPVMPLALDFYLYENRIFKWEDTLVSSFKLTEGEKLYDVLGPYNFIEDRFNYITKFEGQAYFVSAKGDKQLLGRRDLDYVTFSYGFVFHDYANKEDRIYIPSNSYLIVNNLSKHAIEQICGPFMCFSSFGAKGYQTVDLWSTLQRKRKEPIEFISSQHCNNCGFIASIVCDSCESSFCGTSCASVFGNSNGCKH